MPAKNNRKELTGTVVSDKMTKTVSVAIARQVIHPLYKKFIKKTTKVLAHDEKEECGPGDMVTIKEVRPMSKKKKWMVTAILKKAAQGTIELKDDGSDKDDTGTDKA